MRMRARALTLVVAALGTAAGCSNDDADVRRPDPTASAASGVPATTSVTDDRTPDTLVIDVSIAGGSVAPTNERIDAFVGEPVTVNVDSDVADELHVHSVPDHSFDVAAASGQSFSFVVEVPGQVALELHETGRTIATLVVRP